MRKERHVMFHLFDLVWSDPRRCGKFIWKQLLIQDYCYPWNEIFDGTKQYPKVKQWLPNERALVTHSKLDEDWQTMTNRHSRRTITIGWHQYPKSEHYPSSDPWPENSCTTMQEEHPLGSGITWHNNVPPSSRMPVTIGVASADASEHSARWYFFYWNTVCGHCVYRLKKKC